jgi:hypothetical protein
LRTITTMPFELTIRHRIRSGRQKWLEGYLHKAFADVRVRGEWFRLSDDDLAALESVGSADGPKDLPVDLIARYEANRTDPLYLELPTEVVDRLRAFAATRGESVRHVLEAAVRRHMAYPPPLVTPLPDAAPKVKPRRGGGGEGR